MSSARLRSRSEYSSQASLDPSDFGNMSKWQTLEPEGLTSHGLV
jgi:hypothetical protein